MEGRTIDVNQVIRETQNGQEYRILWISGEFNKSYWIELTSKGNIPKPFSIDTLENKIKDGTYELVIDNWIPRISDLSDDPKYTQRRDRIWELMGSAVKNEPDIYDHAKRAAILRKVAEDSGVSFNNLYNYLGKYWKSGKIPDAFRPAYGNIGKSRDIYSDSAKRSGRPKKPGAPGKKLTYEDQRHFSDAVKKYFLSRDHNHFKDTYDFLISDWYTKKTEGGEPETLPPDELPSFAQFRNWYYKNRDILNEIKKRDGENTYNLKNRGVTNKTETSLYGPGAAYQIDATVADIYLVSQVDRNKIVGRPEIYFVMDAATHMVTGMYITLKSASWESASLAIRNAAMNKVSYCAQYGIHITEEQWPCHHLPQALVADRGEVESTNADVLANVLGIQVINTPPYRGDLKGIIEQHFRITNLSIPNSTPGKIQSDFRRRGGRDYRLDAQLDIHQFTAIIIRCVLHYNNHHYMKEYPKNLQMRQLGVRPVPLELWNYGIRYQSGGIKTASNDIINYALLPKESGSITEKGICFRKMYYSCAKAETESWFAVARTEGRRKVTVSYDPNDMDLIYIKPYANQDPLECHLLEHNRMYKGLNETEVLTVMDADATEAATFSSQELASSVKLKHFIGQTVSEAKKQKENAPSVICKTEKLANININRQEEIVAENTWQTQKSLEKRGKTIARETNVNTDDPSNVVIDSMIASELDKVLENSGGSDEKR